MVQKYSKENFFVEGEVEEEEEESSDACDEESVA